MNKLSEKQIANKIEALVSNAQSVMCELVQTICDNDFENKITADMCVDELLAQIGSIEVKPTWFDQVYDIITKYTDDAVEFNDVMTVMSRKVRDWSDNVVGLHDAYYKYLVDRGVPIGDNNMAEFDRMLLQYCSI